MADNRSSTNSVPELEKFEGTDNVLAQLTNEEEQKDDEDTTRIINESSYDGIFMCIVGFAAAPATLAGIATDSFENMDKRHIMGHISLLLWVMFLAAIYAFNRHLAKTCTSRKVINIFFVVEFFVLLPPAIAFPIFAGVNRDRYNRLLFVKLSFLMTSAFVIFTISNVKLWIAISQKAISIARAWMDEHRARFTAWRRIAFIAMFVVSAFTVMIMSICYFDSPKLAKNNVFMWFYIIFVCLAASTFACSGHTLLCRKPAPPPLLVQHDETTNAAV